MVRWPSVVGVQRFDSLDVNQLHILKEDTTGVQIDTMNIDTMVIDTMMIDTLSSLEIATKESLIIYPNPTTSRFCINGLSQILNETKIEVYNTYGQQVKLEKNDKSSSDSILCYRLNEKEKGIYFVKILIGHSSILKKIILL